MQYRSALACALALTGCAGHPEMWRPSDARAEAALPPPWTSEAPAPMPAPAMPMPASMSPGSVQASGPALRVLQTAEQMLNDGAVVRGSCYTYIDAIYDRAGYSGWRNRQDVFRSAANGPYANLDLIQPGDWLYIVNHPESTPVGTHSVLFVGWDDRANGYARVVSYVGGRADRPGDLVDYDVTRTYAIHRAIDAQEPVARRVDHRRPSRSGG